MNITFCNIEAEMVRLSLIIFKILTDVYFTLYANLLICIFWTGLPFG